MNPTKTLLEAHNYLVYIAEALNSVSQQFKVDKQDKVILEKYSEDLYEYAKALEKLKNNMEAKEQIKKKELIEDLESKK